MMMRLVPEIVREPVDSRRSSIIRTCCWKNLRSVSPSGVGKIRPWWVLTRPGQFNSGVFRTRPSLAQQMGIELVEGPDLFRSADDAV